MSSQVEFAAVMVPANGQAWWWYDGVTGEQVGEFLTQNKAMLTDIDAYNGFASQRRHSSQPARAR